MRTARGQPPLRDTHTYTHVSSVNNSIIFEIVMFTTYNCNLLLQFQVFDNVSRKDVSRTIVSFHPQNSLFHAFLSLSHTHAHAYAYAYSLSLSLSHILLLLVSHQLHRRYAYRVTRESQGIGGGSGKSNRRLTASKNKPACNVQ